MDCEHAREYILDSLLEPMAAAHCDAVENHLAGCPECRAFAEVQRALDVRLSAALPPMTVSPTFRKSLRSKLHSNPDSVWPEFLPDIAHLAGCAIATVVCVLTLPLPSTLVLLTGGAFTIVTYVLQATLRGSLTGPE